MAEIEEWRSEKMTEDFDFDGEDAFVTLTMDDDSEVECVVLSVFETDGRDYMALLPLAEAEEEEEGGDVYLYRYGETENGELDLKNIESDEEYELVAEAFSQILDEMEANKQLGEEEEETEE